MFIQNITGREARIAHVTNKGSRLFKFVKVHVSLKVLLETEFFVTLGTRVALLVGFVFHIDVCAEGGLSSGLFIAVGALIRTRRGVDVLYVVVSYLRGAKCGWTERTGKLLSGMMGIQLIL